eukprot:CAMPEP_0185829396 /NCGR_PEP_ID=MMETSP1353-20130828/228_1 /TAXON_ID=1077150 /ORGANISM="Erythrolobus australicus, Strain CCMP3124" /LENGTH=157 /DNA_ID=CAMNT_0028527183 /DNA_START=320 /DNA_END=793 /DNA_ORIENTATION=-
MLFAHPTFTAELLTWKPHGCSLVHDHQESSCWVKVLQGSLLETTYHTTTSSSSSSNILSSALAAPQPAVMKGVSIEYSPGCVSYMSGREGIHKMQNPSGTKNAYSLHIYAPPLTARSIFNDAGGLLELDRPTQHLSPPAAHFNSSQPQSSRAQTAAY